MRVEADEAYQSWPTALPAVPPRSELYCLAPIGIGSAQVEGLASYLMRLAEAPRRINRQQLAAQLRAAERSNPRLFFKWSIDEMRAYLNGQRPPSLAFLLALCWELEIGLSGFLTSGATR